MGIKAVNDYIAKHAKVKSTKSNPPMPLGSKMSQISPQQDPGPTEQPKGSVSNTTGLTTAVHWQLASTILTPELNKT